MGLKRNTMNKKVYFAGLLSEKNLGDIVIIESTEGLYREALFGKGDFIFKRLNLQFSNLSFVMRVVRKLRRMSFKMLKVDANKYELSLLKNYYRKQLKDADLIVLVGGGLIKYKYQEFFLYLTALIDVAEEKNIPLIINAAGVEGYDENDARCQLLKDSLNRSIVKSITTRDDIETLNNKYIEPGAGVHTDKVADPAVYCNEIYQIEKNKSDVFGIGLVRGGIFLDNEREFGPDNVVDFYAELITEMETRGLKYQLFTNGASADIELVPAIERKLNNRKLDVIAPSEDKALIETISTFTTVIAARLHANIISYALNVPSVGLVWNDKLTLFGEDIGYPERFFEYNEFDVKRIVDAAVLANEQGYEQQQWISYKKTAKDNINYLIEQWLGGKL